MNNKQRKLQEKIEEIRIHEIIYDEIVNLTEQKTNTKINFAKSYGNLIKLKVHLTDDDYSPTILEIYISDGQLILTLSESTFTYDMSNKNVFENVANKIISIMGDLK